MVMTSLVTVLEAEFERCAPWIEAALEYAVGTHTLWDVKQSVINGKFTLWPTPDAFMITEIEHYPRRDTCHVFLAGGNMDGLKWLLPKVEKYARDKGCSAITLTGRKGWARSFLTDEGFAWQWVVMAKELHDG